MVPAKPDPSLGLRLGLEWPRFGGQVRVAFSGRFMGRVLLGPRGRKGLIYVHGLSERIHGNEEQRRRDRRIRVKAELAG